MLNAIKKIFQPAKSPIPINAHATALKVAIKPQMSIVSKTVAATPAKEEETIFRHAKLIMVTMANNNKFYEMKENADDTFTAYYGRVGSSSSTANYPMSKWNTKLNEKKRKGYIDQTHLFTEAKETADFADISDADVSRLINELMSYSRESIARNYNVMAGQVTRKQLAEAQAVLDKLAGMVRLKRMQVKKFNEELMRLYSVIPRSMTKVQDHIIERPSSQDDIQVIEKKLAEEQATLDVMRGEVEALEQQKDPQQAGQAQTLTEALGIRVEPLTESTLIDSIKKMMGKDSGKFHRAFKVVNGRTQEEFDCFVEKSDNKCTELFWHGSRNENWLSIMKTGLVLRPANAIISGKMFGYGLYFADKFRKSLNYTSMRGSFWAGGTQNKGYLALYDVHLGNPLKIQKHAGWCSQLTEEKLKKKGKDYDSVFAKGGADLINNEYIVYNQAQCTVRYLVEVHA